ncbi:MAG: cation:proton antiporter, partial [Myxococcaceae bacterium]
MSTHPVLIIFAAAVAAPLLAEVRLGFKVPVVVIEVLLGILVGPYVLGIVRFEGFLVPMFNIGMAGTLFMAGMDLEFGRIRGRPLNLALGGWALSLLLAVGAAWLLHVTHGVQAPMIVGLTLATTGLGVLLPVLRDAGVLETHFGRFVLAAGTVGEVGPVVAMSLLLSQRFSTWQELSFLAVFLFIVVAAATIGTRTRQPWVLKLLTRTLRTSSQLPVRMSILTLSALLVLSEKFGFEGIFGAFAAG